jgi:hypothetical protein
MSGLRAESPMSTRQRLAKVGLCIVLAFGMTMAMCVAFVGIPRTP